MNKELRLGNYVMANNDIFIINSICYEPMFKKIHVTVVNKFGDIPIALVGLVPSPIPLTEEILLKCGFEKNDYEDNVFYHKESSLEVVYAIRYDEYEPHWHYGHDFEKGNGTSPLWKAIDYLHQLQNLYFALTGEELPINLT